MSHLSSAAKYTGFDQLVRAFGQIVSKENVLTDEGITRYQQNTLAIDTEILMVLKVSSRYQIPQILNVANQHKIPLYPISTGNNWGYGCATPVKPNSVIVDLSGLDRIIEFDAKHGIITIEPGVTQQKLYQFLESQYDDSGIGYMVPTTGAGPSCSVLANALERGFGITPITDHAESITRISAFLADGSLVTSALSELGATRADALHKADIGPNFSSLLVQSNLGIVVAMTIRLARKPDSSSAFIFHFSNRLSSGEIVETTRNLMQNYGSLITAINLMNGPRMLSMLGGEDTLERSEIEKQCAGEGITYWTGMGTIQGDDTLVKVVKKKIKQQTQGKTDNIRFFHHRWIPSLEKLTASGLKKWVPNKWLRQSEYLVQALKLLNGQPSQMALPLAYLKNQHTSGDRTRTLNPGQDQCGLIWYAPLVPMDDHIVLEFEQSFISICRDYGIAPYLTFSCLNAYCAEATIPILYDKEEEGAGEHAWQCYLSLFDMGKKLGCVPYRYNVRSMQIFDHRHSDHWRVINSLKTCLDPHGIIAPGRYDGSNFRN